MPFSIRPYRRFPKSCLLVVASGLVLSCASNSHPKFGLEQQDQCGEVPVGVTIDKGQLDLAGANLGDFSLGKLNIQFTPEFQKVISDAATNALVQDYIRCKAIVRAGVHGDPEMVSYFMRLTHFLSKEREVPEQIQWQQANPIPRKTGLKPADGPSVNAERDQRNNLLRTLRNEYILSHDNLSPGLLAGTEWPPLDWLNRRLGELGEEWSVIAGKNSMELRFSEGSGTRSKISSPVMPPPQAEMKPPQPECGEQSNVVLTRKPRAFVPTWRALLGQLKFENDQTDLTTLVKRGSHHRWESGEYARRENLIQEARFTVVCLEKQGELKLETLGPSMYENAVPFENLRIVFRDR